MESFGVSPLELGNEEWGNGWAAMVVDLKMLDRQQHMMTSATYNFWRFRTWTPSSPTCFPMLDTSLLRSQVRFSCFSCAPKHSFLKFLISFRMTLRPALACV